MRRKFENKIAGAKNFLLAAMSTCFLSSVICSGELDAFVKIIDDNDLAGDEAVYRFTLELFGDSGTELQTYFPGSAVYTGDPSQPVDTCQQYLFWTSEPISNCSYDEAQNMISFPVPEEAEAGFFMYEIGYIKNPSYSQILSGFIIHIVETSTGNVLYASSEDLVQVQIYPNVLTGQTVSASSSKVAEISTYTFTFSATNEIPASGTIEVVFPLDQFEIPDSVDIPEIMINSGSWQTPFVSLSSTGVIFTMPNPGVDPASDPVVSLRLSGIKNPNTMAESQSFSLFTYTTTGATIDEIEEGLTVQNTEAADLTIVQATFFVKTVGQNSMVTFKVQLPVAYESGGYLILTLPDTMSIDDGNLLCSLHIGFESDQGQCNKPESNQIMLFDNILQETLTFTISGLINPPNTMETSGFEFAAYDPLGNVIADNSNQDPATTLSPRAGSLSSISVTRSDSTVGQETAPGGYNVQIQFTTQNDADIGSIAQVKIPLTHFLQDGTDLLCSVAGPNVDAENICYFGEAGSEATEYFIIEFPMPCQSEACPGGSEVTVIVTQGIQNLNWILPDEEIITSIEITIKTSDMLYEIDDKTSSIYPSPDLVEGILDSMSLQKSSGFVWEETELTYSFQSITGVPDFGLIELVFNEETILDVTGTGQDLACEDQDSQPLSCSLELYDDGSFYIQTISVTDLIEIQPGIQVQVKITGINNPKSIKPLTNNFVVKTYTSERYAIDVGSITDASDLTISEVQIPAITVIKPDSSEEIVTGQKQTYEFSIMLQYGLAAQYGRLEIELPEEIEIDTADEVTTCVVYEEITLALLDCQIYSSSLVYVSHTNESEDFASKFIIVKVQNGVKNPPTTELSNNLQFRSVLLEDDLTTNYLVETDDSSIQIQANTPNVLLGVTIIRSEITINKETSLQICFETTNPVPENSKLSVAIPYDQALINNVDNLIITYEDVDDPANWVLTQLTTSEDDTHFTFVLLLPNALDVSPEKTCLNFESNSDSIDAAIMNPSTTASPNNSFALSISTSDSYDIDALSTGIFADPFLSSGPFLESAVEFTGGNVVNDFTELSFEVTPSALIPSQGYLLVRLPEKILYLQDSQTPQCSLNDGTAQNCSNVETETDSIGKHLTQFTIQVDSDQYSEYEVTFTISNVLNKYSAEDSSTFPSVTIQSLDVNGFTINQSHVDLVLQDLEANEGAFITSALRTTSLQVQHETNIEVQFTSKTRLHTNSYALVSFSKTLFDESSTVSCSLDGSSKVCLLLGLSTQDWDVRVELDCSNQVDSVCPDEHTFTITISGFKNRRSVMSEEFGQEVKVATFDPSYHAVDEATYETFGDVLEPGYIAFVDNNFGIQNHMVSEETTFSVEIYFGSDQMTFEGSSNDLFTISSAYIEDQEDSYIFQFDENSMTLECEVDEQESDVESWTMQSDDIHIQGVVVKLRASQEESLTVKILGVKNLSMVKTLISTITLTLTDENGNAIANSEVPQPLEWDVLEPREIPKVLIQRVNTDLNRETDVTISVKTMGIQLLDESVLTIYVPKEELLSTGFYGNCVHQESASCIAQESDDEFLELSIGSLCVNSQEECAKGEQSWLTFTISGVFVNPIQLRLDTESIRASIYTGEYLVAATPNGFNSHVTPTLKVQNIPYMDVSQTGYVTGQETSISVTFRLDEAIYDEECSFVISLPEKTILFGQYQQVQFENQSEVEDLDVTCTEPVYDRERTCKVKKDIQPFDRYQRVSAFPAYAQSIKIDQVCDLISCWETEKEQTLTIQGLYNVEHQRERSSSNMFTLSIVSSSSFVLAEKSQIETGLLDDFEPLQFLSDLVQVTRASDSISEQYVEYNFELQTPNILGFRSYIVLHLPLGQGNLTRSRSRIECKNLITNKISCDYLETLDGYQMIRINDLCNSKDDPCYLNSYLKFSMMMDNPSFLQTEGSGQTIKIEVFTENDQIIEKTGFQEGDSIYVQPPIKGFIIQDMDVSRKDNILGQENDVIKFYAPSGPPLLTEKTNVRVDIPQGFALWKEQDTHEPICTRIVQDNFNNRLEVQLTCTILSTTHSVSDDPDTPWMSQSADWNQLPQGFFSIDQIQIEDICSPSYPCSEYQPIEFTFTANNPHTNEDYWRQSSIQVFFTHSSQEQADLGLATVHAEKMLKLEPNELKINVLWQRPSDFNSGGICLTGGACEIELNVRTKNMLSKDSILRVTLPAQMELISSICEAKIPQSNLVLPCRTSGTQSFVVSFFREKTNPSSDVIVKINSVRMPYTTMPTQGLEAMTQEKLSTGRYSPVDKEKTNQVTFTIQIPGVFESVKIERTTNSRASQLTQLEVTAAAPNSNLYQILDQLSTSEQNEYELILAINFKEQSHGTMVDQIAPYSCFEPASRTSFECNYSQNGFYLQLAKVQNSEIDFSTCAQRIRRSRGCRMQITEEKFTNANFATVNPDYLEDSATATIYLWKKDQMDPYGFSPLSQNVWKVVESQQGIFVTPTLEVAETLSINNFELISDPGLYPNATYLATGESVQLGFTLDGHSNSEANAIQFEFYGETENQVKEPFFFLQDNFMSLSAAVNLKNTYAELKETSTYTDGNQFRISDDYGVSRIVLSYSQDLTQEQLSSLILDLNKGLSMPTSTTVSESSRTLQFMAKLLKVSDQSNLNLDDQRYQILSVSNIFKQDLEIQPSGLRNINTFIDSPLTLDQTFAILSFSIHPRVPASPREPAVVTLDLDPTNVSIENDDLTCKSPETNQLFKCFYDQALNKITLEYYEVWQSEPEGQTQAFLFQIDGLVNGDQAAQSKWKIFVGRHGTLSDQIHAQGKIEYNTVIQGAQEICPKGCSTCSSEGKCIECEVPSETPLLTSDGQCVSLCPDGTFQQDEYCFECSPDCGTCSGSGGHCQTCSEGAIMVDGVCQKRDDCPGGLKLDQFSGKCYRDVLSDIQGFSPCDVGPNCQACGLSSNYCALCKNGFAALDGKCTDECPVGFFSVSGQCYKCSPECKVCGQNASDCLLCHDEDDSLYGKHIFVPWNGRCVNECLPGEFQDQGRVSLPNTVAKTIPSYNSQKEYPQCSKCGDGCNTCENQKEFCTSCYYQKNSIQQAPLYLTKKGTCQKSCPALLNYQDSLLHECTPRQFVASEFSLAMVILILTSLVTTSTVLASHIRSSQTDRSLDIAIAIISLFEFLNKICLFFSLWTSQNYYIFSFTGVSMLGISLSSVFFVQLVLNPMLQVILRRQNYLVSEQEEDDSLQVRAPKHCLLSFITTLSQATSPYVIVGFLTANFMGRRDLNMPLEKISPMYYVLYIHQAAYATIVLTVIQVLVGLCAFLSPTVSHLSFSLAFNCMLIGTFSLLLQWRLTKRFSRSLDKYQKLETDKLHMREAQDEAAMRLKEEERKVQANDASGASWNSDDDNDRADHLHTDFHDIQEQENTNVLAQQD